MSGKKSMNEVYNCTWGKYVSAFVCTNSEDILEDNTNLLLVFIGV